ncbi:glycosyltransferase family 2 protein [Microbacterium mangrovi]|uniref:glycosyltransferase family 2 protein n=1 Tax=Microbacterium mangrovi TaxID=1348253 RepID=UPI00068D2537|nr:glycosyltransferase [Microbacterium mangrovi]
MAEDVKVSVVVATYRPGKGLDRVIRSLDRQSLPHDEWEAIFVDDGSPDDTYARLQELAASRPYMRVTQIENSGWPCRPRNIGTDLARGEYVAYMDHDDELYPDALRDGYAFAKAAGADVLNGKEARTHDPGWAVDTYREDLPQAKFLTTMHPLIPANPHKLYRRAFLNEHGIRFREGGRVVWEDIFFNVLVAKHAEVISTMASTPYYHWYVTGGSGSTTFRRSRDDWWDWLEEVIRAIDADLDADELATQRDLFRRHQYRSRLMGTFNNVYLARPASERAMLFKRAHAIQAASFPERDDVALTRNLTMRAQLLRSGDEALLESLLADDPNIPAESRVTGARWRDGSVELDVETMWVDSTGRRFRHRMQDGRIVKDLPAGYDGVFAPELLDVTDDVAGATVEIGVRSQSSRINWMVPTEARLHWLDEGNDPDFFLTATGRIEPATAAMGKPLSRGIWHFTARGTLGGTTQHKMIPGEITPAIVLDETGSAAVYTRPDGKVVLDFDQTGQPLSVLVQPTGTVRRDGDRTIIDVTGLPAGADWSGATKVEINPDGAGKRAARSLLRSGQLMLGRPQRTDGWYKAAATIEVAGDRQQLVLVRPDAGAVRLRIGTRVPGVKSTFVLESGHRTLRAIVEKPPRKTSRLRDAASRVKRAVRRTARQTADRMQRR